MLCRFLINFHEDRLQAHKILALLEAEHGAVATLVAGATLSCALEKIVREVEMQWGEGVCACILLQDDADRFVTLIAPHFPAAYHATLLESTIGPRSSAFGIAGFSGAPVFSGDIAQDQSWTNARGAALSHGYRACWAAPIFSARGLILGVLGMMFSSSRHPTQDETVLLTVATRASAHLIAQHDHATEHHAHLDMRIDLLACEARLRTQAKAAAETKAQIKPEKEPMPRIILVASIDGALQTRLQHALVNLGCQALQAASSERVMIILGCGIAPDLLLIHVPVAREADSLELARQAKRLLPGLQILFMSEQPGDGPNDGAGLVFGIDSLNQASWVDALSRNMSALLAKKVIP
jgi:GAF domain-containing protein